MGARLAVFDRFRRKHGSRFDAASVSAETLAAYAGKVPQEILDEWKRSGWCGYHKGFLWTVDPSAYSDILSDWIPSTDGVYAMFRSAFGSIIYWDGSEAHCLDVLLGDVSPVPARMDILVDGVLCDDSYLKDVLRLDVFEVVQPRLGQLTKEECYGFMPPMAMGGPGSPETVQRLDLEVHLALLAQATKA
jgi:hypothetical protein